MKKGGINNIKKSKPTIFFSTIQDIILKQKTVIIIKKLPLLSKKIKIIEPIIYVNGIRRSNIFSYKLIDINKSDSYSPMKNTIKKSEIRIDIILNIFMTILFLFIIDSNNIYYITAYEGIIRANIDNT